MGCPPLQKKGGGYPRHLENSEEHTSRYYHSPCVSFGAEVLFKEKPV